MNKDAGSFATFQLFRFAHVQDRISAFKDMGMRSLCREYTQPVFSRHMGSGAGSGFSLWPDWTTYGYFAVWRDKESALEHLEGLNYGLPWADYAEEKLRVLLRCVQVHGKWDGIQPLSAMSAQNSGHLAVLTRARVRFTRLHRFWSHVSQAAKAIENAPGCLFTKGVGEWPLAMQATFSIWESQDAMTTFAYAQGGHQEIIKKTRREKWYSEDMFARFEIDTIAGSYRNVQFE